MNVQSLIDSAKDAFFALAGGCCNSDATLKLNGRSFKIVKLLGEGGFSYVYLAQDLASGRLFALKKIRCPLGQDSVREALKEVEAYKRHRHPNIIRCLDSCVVQDSEDGDGKVVYLFLPYYKNGTIQHIINANAVNHTSYPELSALLAFHGTCLAVQALHTGRSGASGTSSSSASHGLSSESEYPPALAPAGSSTANIEQQQKRGGIRAQAQSTEEDEDEEGLAGAEGDEEGRRLMAGGAHAALEEEAAPMEGAVEMGRLNPKEGRKVVEGAKRWAHRDIKPANVMLADDGTTPILMDFGSAAPARIPVPNRSAALIQQDIAAEMCSMPYRAPELFDVKTGPDLTEAVDIWSLGCTLYAMAFGTSPFETVQHTEHGASISMSVLNGKYSFPASHPYSSSFVELIKAMLVVNPEQRPDITKVLEKTQEAIQRLQ